MKEEEIIRSTEEAHAEPDQAPESVDQQIESQAKPDQEPSPHGEEASASDEEALKDAKPREQTVE